MICTKCKRPVPDGSSFCCFCGRKLTRDRSRTKQRGNGQGTAYLSPNGKTWTAQVVVYNPRRTGKKKCGFPSKTAALAYCPILRDELLNGTEKKEPKTLDAVYQEWEPWYSPRVQSMAGYKAAYAHFHTLHSTNMDEISTGDLQACMDACKAGKRTHQMMKVVAGLLWGYAYDRKYVERKITENLYTGKGTSKKRDPLTADEVEAFRQAIGKHRYAEYIYCLCYLGFRPGELLELRKDQVFYEKEKDIWYIVAGKKTDAGRDRTVTIPDKIIPFILERLYIPGTDLLFPQYTFTRKSKDNPVPLFLGFKPMSDAYLREDAFKPMTAALGIAEGKVPYCSRHTYSNLLKKASGDDRDKAALIGHSDYTFTQTKYQSTNLDELNDITKSL